VAAQGAGNFRPNQEIRGSRAEARLFLRRRSDSGRSAATPWKTSDTGITMLRHLLQKHINQVEDGLDPMNVVEDTRANQKIQTDAWGPSLRPASVLN